MKTWQLWVKGLLAAVIGGIANSVSAMIVAPESFNFNDMPKLGKLAVASAIVSACLYLKQSPLPKDETPPKVGVTLGIWMFIVFSFVLLSTGYARFSTHQQDVSFYENGTIQRKIDTKASSSTFISSKSSLTSFKASQTDKTQGASVGSLNQEADALEKMVPIAEGIARGVAKGLAPVPK